MMQLHHAGHVAPRNGIYVTHVPMLVAEHHLLCLSPLCSHHEMWAGCEMDGTLTCSDRLPGSINIPLSQSSGGSKGTSPCRSMQKVLLDIQAHARPPVAQQVVPTRSSTVDCLREASQMPQADNLILIYQEWKEGRRYYQQYSLFPPFTASLYPQCLFVRWLSCASVRLRINSGIWDQAGRMESRCSKTPTTL